MTCGIYCIENIIDNKKYIGQAKKIERRIGKHKANLRNNSHDNPYLQNAWNKHGEKSFIFYIIEELKDDIDVLNLREVYWISFYNTFLDDAMGYNATIGGNVTKYSEESKKKMSQVHLNPSEETREKLRKASSNPSEETRRKMSEGQKNRPPISEETRKKLVEARKNRPPESEETKRRRSESNMGKKASEETKKKMSDAWKNRQPISNEARKKISDANKRSWASGNRPAISDETKLKMSESAKKFWKKKKENLNGQL